MVVPSKRWRNRTPQSYRPDSWRPQEAVIHAVAIKVVAGHRACGIDAPGLRTLIDVCAGAGHVEGDDAAVDRTQHAVIHSAGIAVVPGNATRRIDAGCHRS